MLDRFASPTTLSIAATIASLLQLAGCGSIFNQRGDDVFGGAKKLDVAGECSSSREEVYQLINPEICKPKYLNDLNEALSDLKSLSESLENGQLNLNDPKLMAALEKMTTGIENLSPFFEQGAPLQFFVLSDNDDIQDGSYSGTSHILEMNSPDQMYVELRGMVDALNRHQKNADTKTFKFVLNHYLVAMMEIARHLRQLQKEEFIANVK